MSYGILLWGNAADIHRVFVLQKRADRDLRARTSCYKSASRVGLRALGTKSQLPRRFNPPPQFYGAPCHIDRDTPAPAPHPCRYGFASVTSSATCILKSNSSRIGPRTNRDCASATPNKQISNRNIPAGESAPIIGRSPCSKFEYGAAGAAIFPSRRRGPNWPRPAHGEATATDASCVCAALLTAVFHCVAITSCGRHVAIIKISKDKS
ncbi:hypothetical protein EVAR_24485_1 [Eumeta japonica]|uniref:Uncharacterized protein n=1 Tax=Eumeta variegata TaxID=151549 RepID=A0A4C1WYX1_EUMVA|nr:hypothetical protein EVAR_24485_1 [Eumeta japonica]